MMRVNERRCDFVISRVHATLSVTQLVRNVQNRDKKLSICPCPPKRDTCRRVYGLVFQRKFPTAIPLLLSYLWYPPDESEARVVLPNSPFLYVGFLEKEIRKDEIPMLDTGENPDAPQPREMIDLEVLYFRLMLGLGFK